MYQKKVKTKTEIIKKYINSLFLALDLLKVFLYNHVEFTKHSNICSVPLD